MLTGDNALVAHAIAKQAGVDEFHADLLPEDKVRVDQGIEGRASAPWRWSATA